MKILDQKKFYTPRFSAVACVSIRRLAWALKTNMVKTIDIIVFILSHIFNREVICNSCKDNSKCNCCIFKIDESSADLTKTWNKLCDLKLFKSIHEL